MIIRMEDSKASRDFLALLPLTLTFEDYAGTEKIAYLPRKLTTEGAPEGSDPVRGSFSYYMPWGNVALFYKDFRYSPQLIPLGTVESGIEIFSTIFGSFSVRIERVE